MYKRYWMVWVSTRGFESLMLVYGTEAEMQKYMRHEFGYSPRYVGASDADVDRCRTLGIKAYIA